jgi:hypothetical protein
MDTTEIQPLTKQWLQLVYPRNVSVKSLRIKVSLPTMRNRGNLLGNLSHESDPKCNGGLVLSVLPLLLVPFSGMVSVVSPSCQPIA